jgi:hypothetical protein
MLTWPVVARKYPGCQNASSDVGDNDDARMVASRWVTEVGLIGRQAHSISLSGTCQNLRISRTDTESFDVDDAKNILAVIAEGLDPLRVDVFVSEQLHR